MNKNFYLKAEIRVICFLNTKSTSSLQFYSLNIRIFFFIKNITETRWTDRKANRNKSNWLWISYIWLGTSFNHCFDSALPSSRSNPRARLVPTMWCLERRMHSIRALSWFHSIPGKVKENTHNMKIFINFFEFIF